MGDRSSIYITSEDLINPTHLYGHLTGEDNVKAVANVLRRTDRVGHPEYLIAQLFYEFAISLADYDGDLGFGISAVNHFENFDDNYSVIVNADNGEVDYKDTHYTKDEFVNKFSEFLNTDKE